MARRPNYSYERNKRARAKAAKKKAKLEARRAKRPTGDDGEEVYVDEAGEPIDPNAPPAEPTG